MAAREVPEDDGPELTHLSVSSHLSYSAAAHRSCLREHTGAQSIKEIRGIFTVVIVTREDLGFISMERFIFKAVIASAGPLDFDPASMIMLVPVSWLAQLASDRRMQAHNIQLCEGVKGFFF